MNENEDSLGRASELRNRAEEELRKESNHSSVNAAGPSSAEFRNAIHELRVHQIELEMQNEELRRAQAELEASRARYFDLYNLAPLGYFSLSETGMILEANLRAMTLLGVERPAVVRHAFSHFVLPEDQDIYYKNHKNLKETDGRESCELRMLRAGAAPFWARVEESALDGTYEAPAFLVMVSDISASKRGEEERRILETRLFEAQKMESVGRLAGGVAHEFNNMLQVINGHADLLLNSRDLPPAFASGLRAIAQAGARSANIVHQLLGFARKQIIAPEILDLNAVIASTLRILRDLMGKDVEMVWKPSASSCVVTMDRAQMDQIMLNLLLNARDAISAVGRVTISTDTVRIAQDGDPFHPDLPAGDYVLVSVSDDGAGMDEETRSKLFEPFFTTKRQGTGKGLGLSTVYGIVKQNDGFIEIESTPKRGTRIGLFFPCVAHATVGPRHDFPPEEIREGTETILLIDEEQTFLTLTRLLLEDLGYTVLSARSPCEGIRLAADFRGEIHLLLADRIMAEMSGRDLRDRIRAVRPGLKCLLMAASETDVTSRAIAFDEHTHFLETPFTRSGLSLTVRAALDDS